MTEYRLDDLARQAGVASTTVRLYQRKGILDPPRIEGRTGWYGESHLRRLQLVARLQDDGFSLAGIARLVERWGDSSELDALAGVEASLDRLLDSGDAVVLAPDELVARFPDGTMTPDAMQRAAGLGLVTLTVDGHLRVADRRFLEAGAALVSLGIPVDVVLDEWEALLRQTDELATRFVALFEAHVAPEDWTAGLDHEGAASLAAQLSQLHALARRIVAAALDDSIARAGRARLGQLLAD